MFLPMYVFFFRGVRNSFVMSVSAVRPNIFWIVQPVQPVQPCSGYFLIHMLLQLIPVAARSKAWVYGRSLACWDYGFEFPWGQGWLSLVSVACCQVEVSVSGRSLVQRSPTECGVSECNREASQGEAMTRICAEAPQAKKYAASYLCV
jgi:hypothetical protein